MIQIQLNLPEGILSALRSSPDEFAQELLIAAVVTWYEVGMISQVQSKETSYWLNAASALTKVMASVCA